METHTEIHLMTEKKSSSLAKMMAMVGIFAK